MDGKTKLVAVAALLVLVGACGEPEQAEEDAAAEPGMTEGMPGGEGAGMGGGGMMGGPMMQSMRAHMDSMQGLSGDRAKAMLAAHRQRVAGMLARMDDETGATELEADEDRDALADSIRTDLTRMRDMSADELGSFMPAHRDRVMRLMAMRDGMGRR